MDRDAEYARSLTKDERSALVYAESCAVDFGGLLEAKRMNEADGRAFSKFVGDDILKYGRIPSKFIDDVKRKTGRNATHYAQLTPRGWVVAGLLRQRRAEPGNRGPVAREIFDELKALKKL